MIKKISLTLFIIVNFMNNVVFADLRLDQKPISISPTIGSVNVSSDQEIDGSGTFGFHLGYMFNENFGSEFIMETGEFSISYCDELDCCHKDIHYNSYFFQFDTAYHIPLSIDYKFYPYVSGGLGAIYSDSDHVENRSSAIVNAGFGFKFFITEKLAFRNDIKYIYSINESNTYFAWNVGFSFFFEKFLRKEASVRNNAKCPYAHKITFSEAYLNSDGCPNDSDNDGIPDYIDSCPNTEQNKSVNAIGCAHDKNDDGIIDDVHTSSIPVLDSKILFRTDSSRLSEKHKPILNELYDLMASNPNLKLEIQGHTDNVGDSTPNVDLSEKRAKTVQKYLMKKDSDLKNYILNSTNLKVKGFGYAAPNAPNDTPEGLHLNRRVNFSIVK